MNCRRQVVWRAGETVTEPALALAETPEKQ
jgi:hypothetical protein